MVTRAHKDVTFLDLGSRFAGCQGSVELDITDSADTTEVVYIGGLPLGRIRNPGDEALTIAIREAPTQNGTAYVCHDKAGDAVANITIPAGGSYQFPDGMTGIAWLVLYAVVGGTGSVPWTISLSLGR